MNFPKELELGFLNGQCFGGDIGMNMKMEVAMWQGANIYGSVLVTCPNASNTETLDYVILCA